MLGAGEAAVLHRLDVGGYGRLDAGAVGHEVANEARRLAGVDAEHIVKYQDLTGAAWPAWLLLYPDGSGMAEVSIGGKRQILQNCALDQVLDVTDRIDRLASSA